MKIKDLINELNKYDSDRHIIFIVRNQDNNPTGIYEFSFLDEDYGIVGINIFEEQEPDGE